MPEQNTPQESSGLTLQDLVLVAQIIQLSSAKGVFRAEDLAQIGSLYNRLVGFLESTGAISRNVPAEGQSSAEDSSEPAVEESAPAEATTAKEKKNAKARR
jgi:hypothetical protein